jgi:hypothetical protein
VQIASGYELGHDVRKARKLSGFKNASDVLRVDLSHELRLASKSLQRFGRQSSNHREFEYAAFTPLADLEDMTRARRTFYGAHEPPTGDEIASLWGTRWPAKRARPNATHGGDQRRHDREHRSECRTASNFSCTAERQCEETANGRTGGRADGEGFRKDRGR